MPAPQKPRQLAYFVADVAAAATRHHALFGSGPYFIARHIPLRICLHRGRESALDHSAAYGQWGDVMVEFVQQNNAGASTFHDMYPAGSGRTGLHHVALFTEDLGAAMTAYEEQGFAVALYAELHDGFAFAMIDTVASLGHMIELYQPEPALVALYGMVAQAAAGFDGRDVLREITI